MNSIKVRILYGLISVLTVFCLALSGQVGGQVSSGSGGGGAGCDTALWDNSSGSPVGDLDITDSIGTVYVGQEFEDTSAHTICKVTVYVTYRGGDISGKTFSAYLVPTASNGYINTANLVEADSTVTGSNDWNETAISFTWSTGYVVAANTSTAFVVTMNGGVDTVNYAELEYYNDGVIPGSGEGTAGADTWSAAGAIQGAGGTYDIKAIFYTK